MYLNYIWMLDRKISKGENLESLQFYEDASEA